MTVNCLSRGSAHEPRWGLSLPACTVL